MWSSRREECKEWQQLSGRRAERGSDMQQPPPGALRRAGAETPQNGHSLGSDSAQGRLPGSDRAPRRPPLSNQTPSRMPRCTQRVCVPALTIFPTRPVQARFFDRRPSGARAAIERLAGCTRAAPDWELLRNTEPSCTVLCASCPFSRVAPDAITRLTRCAAALQPFCTALSAPPAARIAQLVADM